MGLLKAKVDQKLIEVINKYNTRQDADTDLRADGGIFDLDNNFTVRLQRCIHLLFIKRPKPSYSTLTTPLHHIFRLIP